jgi:sugar phosphate isomerase/epimerase
MRVIVPSWLVPGGWLENVRAAASLPWAEGVELLCFSFEGEDRELFISELPGLAEEGKRLSLSVHLPDPLLPAHEELVELTRPFAAAYVVHPPRRPAKGASMDEAAAALESWSALVSSWRGRYGDDFLLEYTEGAAFSAAEESLVGVPLCADTGRLLLEEIDPVNWIAQRVERIREVHLHGADGLRDHRVFSGSEPWLAALRPLLAAYEGRVELEVFSLASVTAAAAVLFSHKEQP